MLLIMHQELDMKLPPPLLLSLLPSPLLPLLVVPDQRVKLRLDQLKLNQLELDQMQLYHKLKLDHLLPHQK
jgi:hypothetical protein